MAFDGMIPADEAEQAPFGLFDVASVVERDGRDEHWGQGFDAMSENCTFSSTLIDVCAAVEPIDVFVADGERSRRVRPFGITALDECLTIGFNAEDREARVRRQLELVTPKAVEKELWNGLYRQAWLTEEGFTDSDPEWAGFLTSAEETSEVSSGPFKATVALALLEQAFANCSPGIRATIHMPPAVGSILGDHLHVDDKKLQTNVGNFVAIGQGYNGSGPGEDDPADPTVLWMYATGPVHVVLGSKEMVSANPAQAVNIRTNEMTWVADRPAAVYTDPCCQLGVQVDLTL